MTATAMLADAHLSTISAVTSMREAGLTWRQCGAALGINHSVVYKFAKANGLTDIKPVEGRGAEAMAKRWSAYEYQPRADRLIKAAMVELLIEAPQTEAPTEDQIRIRKSLRSRGVEGEAAADRRIAAALNGGEIGWWLACGLTVMATAYVVFVVYFGWLS